MKAVVNGVERELPGGWTVARLLASLEMPREGVAVAVNDRLVPRSEHERVVLAAGDRIEVVHAVAGG